jgi:hypothetical protein
MRSLLLATLIVFITVQPGAGAAPNPSAPAGPQPAENAPQLEKPAKSPALVPAIKPSQIPRPRFVEEEPVPIYQTPVFWGAVILSMFVPVAAGLYFMFRRQTTCPKCNETDPDWIKFSRIKSRQFEWRRRYKYHCFSCGYRWRDRHH